jgi:hypothetical protein
MKRLMYIESKGEGPDGEGRIGWVELSKSRRSYHYAGRSFQKVAGYKYNCIDSETGEHYWISGPKKNGKDKLYGGLVEIDDDAREEYWVKVRGKPECKQQTSYRA